MTDRYVNTKLIYNLPLRMRDGVRLMCDVIRPDTEEKLPTILVRTAYLKESVYGNEKGPWLVGALNAASRGYNFVVQDARGTGWSEGVCDPSGHQAEDGYDTVEAIAQMPWSDGQVGMVGESFLGYVCLEAARMNPPHLRCVIPCEAGWLKNPYFNRYGVPTVGSHGWCYGRALDRDAHFHDLPQETKQKIADMRLRDAELLTHLPLNQMPQDDVPNVAGLDKYREILEHIGDDAYLAEIGRDDAFEQVRVPVMLITGWLDPELNTTVYNYVHFRERGGSRLTRENARLIVGPWNHGGTLPGAYSGLHFGPQGSGLAYGVDEKILAFFDYWMKGKDSEFMSGKPVHLFEMCSNEWRRETVWPPEQTRMLPYYLHSAGHANTLHGDGRLDALLPANEQPDTYVYDPGDPIPTIPRNTENARTADQSGIEERDDILVYTTPPFESAVQLAGMVTFRFYAASTAVDTDFVGKLLLVHPDGKAVEIFASLVRARYRNGRQPQFLTPGETCEYALEIGNVCLRVGPGYALRLEVCSCLFPLAARNTNLGGEVAYETEYVSATQTLYHDAERPSCLLLPLYAQA